MGLVISESVPFLCTSVLHCYQLNNVLSCTLIFIASSLCACVFVCDFVHSHYFTSHHIEICKVT